MYHHIISHLFTYLGTIHQAAVMREGCTTFNSAHQLQTHKHFTVTLNEESRGLCIDPTTFYTYTYTYTIAIMNTQDY